ncbi:MAG TPA: PfkB family carbohydrate kinase [Vicinamibacterales bacterium]|nr:PfkB family carbohydrate kinase [Vicinamibacterales bacterium]
MSDCDVVGIGENSVDLVYRVPRLAGAGDKVRATGCRRLLGGQVATTLCTCAAMGLRARYVGTFGNDEHGRLIRSELEQRGIDTSHAVVRYAPNRHAVVLVDEHSGERTIVWQRDSSLALRQGDLSRDAIAGARVLHLDNVDEDTAITAARLGRDAGLIVTTDIDQVTERTSELVAAVTFPMLAERVPQALTGETDPQKAIRALRQQHEGMLCVTRGPRGSMLLVGTELHEAPAFEVTAVDTTGAGDVFRGALIYSLLRGDRPDSMLRFANAAAALSCTREGAIAGIPNLREIEGLLAERAT